jgi:hypothetical protein
MFENMPPILPTWGVVSDSAAIGARLSALVELVDLFDDRSGRVAQVVGGNSRDPASAQRVSQRLELAVESVHRPGEGDEAEHRHGGGREKVPTHVSTLPIGR